MLAGPVVEGDIWDIASNTYTTVAAHVGLETPNPSLVFEWSGIQYDSELYGSEPVCQKDRDVVLLADVEVATPWVDREVFHGDREDEALRVARVEAVVLPYGAAVLLRERVIEDVVLLVAASKKDALLVVEKAVLLEVVVVLFKYISRSGFAGAGGACVRSQDAVSLPVVVLDV